MKNIIKLFCLFLALIIATNNISQAQSLILDGDVLLENPNEKFKKLKNTSPYKKIQKDSQKDTQKDNLPVLKAKKDVKVSPQEETKDNLKETIKGKTTNFHGNTESSEVSYKESLIKIVFHLAALWITAIFS